ncbi:MAG: glucose-6-phosphate isomerase family protein [Bryobacteraceae bacterium]|jgi:glucose-6-phosphate isomerase
MKFDPGFDIEATSEPLGFRYGETAFGPPPELRSLAAIRPALRDPNCAGPDPVYAIVMDIGARAHRRHLQQRMLLFGAVTYAAGRLGDEVVRSQGHAHKVSSHSGWAPPEVYEIWSGAAFIFMQEFAGDDPGRCFAIHAQPGDIVIVPPGWTHGAMSADPARRLTFGALCDREYGFEYDEIRKRRGLAWYAIASPSGQVSWEPNPRYRRRELTVRAPGDYSAFGFQRGAPLYRQFEDDFDKFQWVSQPALVANLWERFTP